MRVSVNALGSGIWKFAGTATFGAMDKALPLRVTCFTEGVKAFIDGTHIEHSSALLKILNANMNMVKFIQYGNLTQCYHSLAL
mmetsp:Transcript_49913/g.53876  ORF Transcript_49913/g.53876 Transcript_49913/m.53876 type:complete len:83 (+) Transcript_49913:1038-1286(+)